MRKKDEKVKLGKIGKIIKKGGSMKGLIFVLLFLLLISCSKITYPEPEEPKYFDLWVKNPISFSFEIFLNDSFVAISEGYTHEKKGNFLQTDTIYLQAIYEDTNITFKEKIISTQYWRKPSYTFYLYPPYIDQKEIVFHIERDKPFLCK